MGKIVKYCAACEESFAEKFGFCPNCGNAMESFEMNPLKNNAEAMAEVKPGVTDYNHFAAKTSLPEAYETSPKFEPSVADTAAFTTVGETQTFSGASDLKDDVEPEVFDGSETGNFEDAANETETFAATATTGANGNGNQYQTKNYSYQPALNNRIPSDDGYHITVIQEKNVKQRNLLLLGAMVVMLTLTVGGMIYSIFNHPLLVGAIGEDLMLSVPLVDNVPMEVEEAPKKNPDKGGGGGGGGREEETPTSKGRLATQTEKPIIAPDKSIVQKDFELKQPVASTQGDRIVKPTDEPYGDPNSKYTLGSNGTGKGGGQGSGVGTGQGSGRGTGQGSGLGSGSGSGDGNGNGDGTGDGDRDRVARNAPPPPPPKVGITEKIKFISKPRAGYTDQARTNQIQGTVRLRVTFLPSGQIGSITPVSGLPYGLTEQAIAAARQIRFEPAKKNGVPITSAFVVEYNFNIY
ncbi:MAG: energy transducer TonB [Pyrinomonadaceae bacterium]